MIQRLRCWWRGRHIYERCGVTNVRYVNGLVAHQTEHYRCLLCGTRTKVDL